jgi:DNA-binding IclR family transcriptional regulator
MLNFDLLRGTEALRMKIQGRGVQSIEVGGRILKVLVEKSQPMMLRDIAGSADIVSARAHTYLVSFRKMGLVEQDAASGQYQIGPFALQLGVARLKSFPPLRVAGDAVVNLADELGLMVGISVWGNQGPTVVQLHEAGDQLSVNVRAGTVFSVTGTATGRAFAAYLPQKITDPLVKVELREGPSQRRVGIPTSRAELSQQIAKIRRLGYASTEGLPIPGINAISAPVFDHSGAMQLAITLIGNAAYLNPSPESAFAARLLSFVRGISEAIGCTSNRVTPER